MQAGKLDQYMTIKQPSVSNTSGSVIETFSTVATVMARVISEKGTEAFQSARINAKDRIRVQIRYRTDIDVRWRLVWMGQIYNVLNVDRSMMRQGEMWLTAECVGAE